MKFAVQALRPVVAGVGVHLSVGENATIDAFDAGFLVSAGLAKLVDPNDEQRLQQAIVATGNARHGQALRDDIARAGLR